MATRFRLDPSLSRFTVQAFATGMLSFMGHNPTFAVREFAGSIGFDHDTVETMQLALTIQAASLQLMDEVKPSDRNEIEGTMRERVLEVGRYPEIRYEGRVQRVETMSTGRHRIGLDGQLALHGITRPHSLQAELQVFGDGVRLSGQTGLRLSDYRIEPVSALGGMIKLKDELRLVYDLGARPEGA